MHSVQVETTTDQSLEPTIEDFLLRLAMVDWRTAVERMPDGEQRMLEVQAAAMAIHAARVSAYISRRRSNGSHEAAVTAQNQTARKVRRALGYTYADDVVNF